jgi:ABC-type multidrug transport system ATPase subunit
MNAPAMSPLLPPPVIACRQVGFRFPDGTQATRDVSFEIHRGELFCLLGANGAGKTTLIRQITAELVPTMGAIEVLGRDVRQHARWAKERVGILPQSVGLFGVLTVAQHLSSFAPLKGIPRSERAGSIGSIVSSFELERLLPKRAASLSLGQQRWVLVALAMLGDPPILILDEPTVGMDPVARRRLWAILQDAKARGVTILLTTHYLDEAEQLADRIGFLDEGRLGPCGSLADLYTALGKSVRVSITDPATGACIDRVLFDTLAQAQRYVAERGLASYAVGRITLEDIYLRLVAHDLDREGGLPLSATGLVS